MPLKKQYLKSKPVCKVTFRVPKEAAKSATDIKVVGEFNDWDPASAVPMKQLKNGDFTASVDLSTEKPAYAFRYIYDDGAWENDWEADAYTHSGIDAEENSIVQV